ncbi:MAG: phytanoyl-CoA dioxygenase [Opitutae bacterium]|nr:phytanoyl-CoA dioxygenase [Opitutae bacterium]
MSPPFAKAFEEDGFVEVSGFCNPVELSAIESALARFIDLRVPQLPAEEVFYEDKAKPETLKQIQRMHEHDDFFGAFIQEKPKALAQELLGEPVICKNLQFFNKPPGISQATPAHQDGHYFMLHPCNAVTMWMALDTVDEENGCVRYLRGSHLDGMRHHERTQTLGFSQGIANFGRKETREEVACTAKPGDLLAHHAMTVHWADANASRTRNRRALGFIFYGESAREDKAAHQAYQKKLVDEMSALGKI